MVRNLISSLLSSVNFTSWWICCQKPGISMGMLLDPEICKNSGTPRFHRSHCYAWHLHGHNRWGHYPDHVRYSQYVGKAFPFLPDQLISKTCVAFGVWFPLPQYGMVAKSWFAVSDNIPLSFQIPSNAARVMVQCGQKASIHFYSYSVRIGVY